MSVESNSAKHTTLPIHVLFNRLTKVQNANCRRCDVRTSDAVVGHDVQLRWVDVGRLAEDERQRERHEQYLDGLLEQQTEKEACQHRHEERHALLVAERERVEDDKEGRSYCGKESKAPGDDDNPPRQRSDI